MLGARRVFLPFLTFACIVSCAFAQKVFEEGRPSRPAQESARTLSDFICEYPDGAIQRVSREGGANEVLVNYFDSEFHAAEPLPLIGTAKEGRVTAGTEETAAILLVFQGRIPEGDGDPLVRSANRQKNPDKPEDRHFDGFVGVSLVLVAASIPVPGTAGGALHEVTLEQALVTGTFGTVNETESNDELNNNGIPGEAVARRIEPAARTRTRQDGAQVPERFPRMDVPQSHRDVTCRFQPKNEKEKNTILVYEDVPGEHGFAVGREVGGGESVVGAFLENGKRFSLTKRFYTQIHVELGGALRPCFGLKWGLSFEVEVTGASKDAVLQFLDVDPLDTNSIETAASNPPADPPNFEKALFNGPAGPLGNPIFAENGLGWEVIEE